MSDINIAPPGAAVSPLLASLQQLAEQLQRTLEKKQCLSERLEEVVIRRPKDPEVVSTPCEDTRCPLLGRLSQLSYTVAKIEESIDDDLQDLQL